MLTFIVAFRSFCSRKTLLSYFYFNIALNLTISSAKTASKLCNITLSNGTIKCRLYARFYSVCVQWCVHVAVFVCVYACSVCVCVCACVRVCVKEWALARATFGKDASGRFNLKTDGQSSCLSNNSCCLISSYLGQIRLNCTSVSLSFLKWHAKPVYVPRGLEIEVYFRNRSRCVFIVATSGQGDSLRGIINLKEIQSEES